MTGLKNGNKSQYARDREVLKRQNDEFGIHYKKQLKIHFDDNVDFDGKLFKIYIIIVIK